MNTVFKDIPNYQGKYQISNKGEVLSLNYKGSKNNPRVLVPKKNNNGYLWVELSKDGIKKPFLIHRLVAQVFLPNPYKLPQVNHKDENKENNTVDNLEWCTHKYNNLYSRLLHPERSAKNIKRKPPTRQNTKHSKMLLKIDLSTGEIVEKCGKLSIYCKEHNLNNWSIIQCCKGKRNKAYGYYWQFSDEDCF